MFLFLVPILILLVLGVAAIAAWGLLRIGQLERAFTVVEERLFQLKRAIQDLEARQGRSEPATSLQPTTPVQAPVPSATIVESTDAAKEATPRSPGQSATTPLPPVAPPLPSHLPEPDSLEQRLGTRWAVWAGGIALALGGILLVRFAIDAGLLSPAVRIALAALLAVTLIAVGEWMRSSNRAVSLPSLPFADIPAVLSAAGIVTAFATAYAAYALYAFISPEVAFVLLGLIGMASLFAAGLHGPMLAALGIVGSYVTPLLVASQNPAPWPLIVFLAIVTATALQLAQWRRTLWLAIAALAGAGLWTLPIWISSLAVLGAGGAGDWPLALLAHGVLNLALTAWFFGFAPHDNAPEHIEKLDEVALAALATMAAVTVVCIYGPNTPNNAWQIAALLAIGILGVTSWLSPPAVTASAIAGVFALAALVRWPVDWEALEQIPRSVSGFRELLPLADLGGFGMFAAVCAAAVAVPAGLRLELGSRPSLRQTAVLLGAATLAPLLILAYAYARMRGLGPATDFAAIAVALAAVFTYLADRWRSRRGESGADPVTNLALAGFAAAAIGALALALPMLLERGYLTVAFALAALGAAFVAARLAVPHLGYAAAGLGALVLIRIVLDPRIMGGDIGALPIVNWLLIGYGVPTACFWYASRLLGAAGTHRTVVQFLESLAVLFAGLLAFFQLRHLIHGADLLRTVADHSEFGLMTLLALGFAYALGRLRGSDGSPVLAMASLITTAIAVLISLVMLGLFGNPLFVPDKVFGLPVFSSLLLGYLAPALAAAAFAWAIRSDTRTPFVGEVAPALGIVAILLVFGYATLETRHLFQGADINYWRPSTEAEIWAYSAAWLGLGVLLLGYGLWRGVLTARAASGVLIMLTIIKVFVFDLAGLEGPWRALSFLLLGVVLIAIGIVYQRLLQGPKQQIGVP